MWIIRGADKLMGEETWFQGGGKRRERKRGGKISSEIGILNGDESEA